MEYIRVVLHGRTQRAEFCRLLSKLVPKAVIYGGRSRWPTGGGRRENKEDGGRIRRRRERGSLLCSADSMLSHTSSNPVLPADFYVQFAHACREVPSEKLKGSGTLVRAKQCCFCTRTIKLGSGSSNYSLQQHMLSYECQKHQKKFADSAFDLPSILSNIELPGLKPATQVLNSQSPMCLEPCKPADCLSLAAEHAGQNLWLENFEACPGALVDYGMSIFTHYPWHLHDLGFLDYKLSFIDPKGRFFRVSSNRCYQTSPGRGAACEACNQIVLGSQFQELMKRATLDPLAVPSTKLQFWTYSQLCVLLKEKTSQLNELKLKVRVSLSLLDKIC
jgi:hypothetical protein